MFFATADRDNLTPTAAQEDWNRGLDNIADFLVHFAAHFTDADVYNALKHGLAVRPGHAATELDDGELLKAEARRSSTSASGAIQTTSLVGIGLPRGFGPIDRWASSTWRAA